MTILERDIEKQMQTKYSATEREQLRPKLLQDLKDITDKQDRAIAEIAGKEDWQQKVEDNGGWNSYREGTVDFDGNSKFEAQARLNALDAKSDATTINFSGKADAKDTPQGLTAPIISERREDPNAPKVDQALINNFSYRKTQSDLKARTAKWDLQLAQEELKTAKPEDKKAIEQKISTLEKERDEAERTSSILENQIDDMKK